MNPQHYNNGHDDKAEAPVDGGRRTFLGLAAGLTAATPFYDTLLGIAMWVGRYAVAIPVLAIAGSLARKRRVATTAGTLPTHGPLFVVLLIGVVVLVGALTFLPALALGPIAEHFLLFSAR